MKEPRKNHEELLVFLPPRIRGCTEAHRGKGENLAVSKSTSRSGSRCGKIESWVYWVQLLPQGERVNSQTAEGSQMDPGTKLRNTKSFQCSILTLCNGK
ncbi:hypothetical protein CQ018_12645 [Arthrobacter sp. MYb227]|nr:hypothetical protein CQ018_12645 [Arthrobacter sp. MYb227]